MRRPLSCPQLRLLVTSSPLRHSRSDTSLMSLDLRHELQEQIGGRIFEHIMQPDNMGKSNDVSSHLQLIASILDPNASDSSPVEFAQLFYSLLIVAYQSVKICTNTKTIKVSRQRFVKYSKEYMYTSFIIVFARLLYMLSFYFI